MDKEAAVRVESVWEVEGVNVGLLDALIRLALGWLMIHWGIMFKVRLKRGTKLITSILGTVLLLTAVTRYCFIYTLLNFSTF